MKRIFVSLLIISMCALALLYPSVAHNQEKVPASQASQSTDKFRRGARSIAGQYIVTFNDDIDRARLDSTAETLATLHGGRIIYIYKEAIKGFAVQMSEKDAIALSQNPMVVAVSEDGYSEVAGRQSTPQGPTTFWGLDRIDQRNLPLDNTYHYRRVGTGVHAYVFDTGIWVTHEQFAGRAHAVGSPGGGFDAFGGDGIDRNNHGTLVSGVIGGTIHGVAKNVELHAVKVCNDSGQCPDTSVIAGLDWLISNHVKPAVANLSLAGHISQSSTYPNVDNAVRSAIAAGIICVLGAGNSNADVVNFYPAHVAEAITVGATTRTDTKASYSNYGFGIDLFAPGGQAPDHYIPTTASGWFYGGANNVTDGFVGTSAAAPHVTGAVAQYLQVNRNASPANVAAAIIANATNGVLSNTGPGSPNRLLYSHFLAPIDNRADFDGDYKSDISSYNLSTGLWHSRNSSNEQIVDFAFGQKGDIMTPGDYNGDGKTDRAVFRPGNGFWYIATDTSGSFYGVSFGLSGDIPVARDYDADGKTDVAVWRPSNGIWYIINSSNNGVTITQFGQAGDLPVPGDYDIDNKADIAVFRPSNGTWYFLRSDGTPFYGVQFGRNGDRPVQADYDGDCLTDIAMFLPDLGQWWILRSSDGLQVTSWGVSSDRLVPADYDGDGKADIAVQAQRPDTTDAWWILKSSGGYEIISFSSQFPVQEGYLTQLY